MKLDKVIKNLRRFENRIDARRQVLTRIGLRLTNRLVMEITRQDIVDSGLTRNSVKYRVEDDSLQVDVMGSRYAKFHEFGTKPSAKMARFLKWRLGQLKKAGKSIPPSKGVIQWSGIGRNQTARILPRPFFWPTIEKEQDYIKSLIEAYFSVFKK